MASVLEMLGSPPVKSSAAHVAGGGGGARGTPPSAGAAAKRAREAQTPPLSFAPRESRPAAETPEKRQQQQPGEAKAAAGNARRDVDASTGKLAQKSVHAKKTKEEELRRAAELLCANEGKFAAPLDGEGGEEPSDEAEDVGDETWDPDRRTKVARAAWALAAPEMAAAAAAIRDAPLGSAAFDPAASAPPRVAGRLAFGAVVPLLEVSSSGGGEAPMLCAVCNFVRQVLHHCEDKAADLHAALQLLLSGAAAPPLQHRALAEATAIAFGLPRLGWKGVTADDLPAWAASGRTRQRTLMRARGASVAEVAAMLAEGAVGESARSGDRLVKLLSSSPSATEASHLVRVLQGRPALTWDLVLRGLAHAVAAERGAAAEALVAAEDDVFRAFAQVGGLSPRFVELLLEGRRGEALLAECPPACGAPVFFMRAEQPRDLQAAIAKLAGSGPVVVEWLYQGERAQVHVQGGRVSAVFVPAGASTAPRADLVEEAAGVLEGSLRDTEECILDVIFLTMPRKRGNAEDAAGAESAQAESPGGAADDAAPEGSPQKPPSPEKAGGGCSRDRCIVALDIISVGGASLAQAPLRERRARLARAMCETPRVRVALGAELPEAELTEAVLRAKLDEALSAMHLATSREAKAFGRADGVLVKLLDGPGSVYVAGRRSSAWQALLRPPVTGPEADRRLLDRLTEEEKKHLPEVSEFHFTVVSGFRTRSVEGINDILRIQKLYNDAGVVPTWYVDNECPDEYRKLGLKVVKAGKLLPARNHALIDAEAEKKICVQTSDDIGSWTFLDDASRYFTDEEANAAAKRCEKLEVSPVAAARYLAAIMRSRGPGKCRLGGVYPLSNTGRAMRARPFIRENFILGDFFVAEVSPCRFDERMSLKEDYDFTCSHLQAFGEVLRCNRLIITAKHETNAGGACAIRDAAGERERFNIGILLEKWPDCFKAHPTRTNQVVLRWTQSAKRKAGQEISEAGAQRAAKQAKKSKSEPQQQQPQSQSPPKEQQQG